MSNICFIIFLAEPEVQLDLEEKKTTKIMKQEHKSKKQPEPKRVSKRLQEQEQDQKQEDEEEKSPKKKSKPCSKSEHAEELVSGWFYRSEAYLI